MFTNSCFFLMPSSKITFPRFIKLGVNNTRCVGVFGVRKKGHGVLNYLDLKEGGG